MEKDASKLYLREESRTSGVLVGENDKFCVLTRRMVYGVTLFAVVIFVINLSSIALAVSNYNKLLDMQEDWNNKFTNSKSSAFQMVEPTKTMRSNFKKLHAGARPNPSPDDGVTWTRSGFLKTAKPSISTENGLQKSKVSSTVSGLYMKSKGDTGPNIRNCSCEGIPGPRGPRGPIGLPGPKGSAARKKGKKGDPGPRGHDGTKGVQGDRGHRGERGLQGEKGDRGGPGKAGPYGPVGPQGGKGEPGTPGSKGIKGEKGGGVTIVKEKPRPLAHITGNVNRRKPLTMPRGILRKEWTDFGLFARVDNGFTFKNGELIVPEDGVYYVYSQVYFKHDDKDKDPTMAHFMYRISGTNGETLLTNLVTRSVQLGNHLPLFNGYTGGMFHCRKGDRLMVGVSEELLRMAQFVESFSYFGAFLVQR